MSQPSEGQSPQSPELYPGYAAEAQRARERAAEITRAARVPAPGPLLDAFAGIPATIAGLTVRPVVHYDFVILRQLKSPLLDQLAQAGQDVESKPTPFTDHQAYELILQFTRPIREIASLLAKGRELFRQTAIESVGMTLSHIEVALIIRAVEREFVRSFNTILEFTDRKEAGDGSVFTPPPAAPKTGSAGG